MKRSSQEPFSNSVEIDLLRKEYVTLVLGHGSLILWEKFTPVFLQSHLEFPVVSSLKLGKGRVFFCTVEKGPKLD